MNLRTLIEQLSRPDAYPERPSRVEVRQTHISAVFLAGPHAYKIKKPVRLGYLDFGTLELRRHFAQEEVRLNLRLAPGVYLGVVPIVETSTGLSVGGEGRPVEWAVKMECLPETATLRNLLARDVVDAACIGALATRIAAFHRQARGGPEIAEYGRFPVVRGNVEENLEAANSQVGITISAAVETRLATRTREELSRLEGLIENRADRGVPRDAHGDLRLDHVYLFPERSPERDVLIVDCIEFNERFRFMDPVCDAAFLAMDLAARGRFDLSRVFRDAYIEATGDAEGRPLWALYQSYRSAVRAKVAAQQLAEPEIPDADRREASSRARAHWIHALATVEPPENRPGLVLIGGLPGSGKSTLASRLAELAGFAVVRSDVERKRIAGLGPESAAPARYREGIYSPEFTQRTYQECLALAEARLFDGGRVIVDASFLHDGDRRKFLEVADRLGIPSAFLQCEAKPETVLRRLESRRDDPSDADRLIYEQAFRLWEPPGARSRRDLSPIRTDEPFRDPILSALSALQVSGLYPNGDAWR